ncbi:MAG TPA: hypothetical protein VGL61_04580 [Kofleriaceae bacterium]|jgi:hypothetical protein
MTARVWFLVFASACGAKHDAGGSAGSAGSAQPTGSAQAPVASATPAWRIDSQVAPLMCGSKPLAMPPPHAPPASPASSERELPRATPIAACNDQPSLDTACKCLVASAGTWAKGIGLAAPVSCAPAPQGDSTTRLLDLHSVPADPDAVSAGTAFAVAIAHASTWSVLGIAERAADIDLTETPKATRGAAIDRFESKARGDSTVVWIETDNAYSETSMGEDELSGGASVTVCVLPAAQRPYCSAPLKLGHYEYTFARDKDGQPDACSIREASRLSAHLDSAGSLTIELDNGSDTANVAGRYRL